MAVSLNSLILAHLLKYHKITSQESFALYGNTRLSSSIHELRAQGCPIETVMLDGYNRYGQPTRYAEYRIPKGWKPKKQK